MDEFNNYRALLAQVDGFGAQVARLHAGELRCRRGCTACCRQDLSVSRVEAEFLLRFLVERGELPPSDGAKAEADDHPLFDALASGPDACVFLGPEGACGVYEARPIICRTHGFPLQLADGAVDVCPLNFQAHAAEGYATIPKGARLGLDALNQKLGLVDLLYSRAQGEEPGRFLLSGVREAAQEILAAGGGVL